MFLYHYLIVKVQSLVNLKKNNSSTVGLGEFFFAYISWLLTLETFFVMI